MLPDFLRRYLRRRRLARHAFADADWQRVLSRQPLLAACPDAQLLRETATLLLADKVVVPSEGFALSTDMQLEIAGLAALPVLHIGLSAYDGFHAFIVYPDEFLAPREEEDEYGIVHTGHEQVAGESWDYGPILLSWRDVEAAREQDGYNVVIHECAHKLDAGDGDINGVPALAGRGISAREWQQVMREAWQITGREEQLLGVTSIDDYALDSPAEFFAVMSEHFFAAADDLAADHPAVYQLLCRYYGMDPQHWRIAASDAKGDVTNDAKNAGPHHA